MKENAHLPILPRRKTTNRICTYLDKTSSRAIMKNRRTKKCKKT